MLDWIGSLRVREQSSLRIALSLSRTTRVIGLAVVAVGAYLVALVWSMSPLWLIVPCLVILAGAILATLHREFVFDREAGVMRIDQRTLGMGHRSVVPLFHLRAVVIIAKPQHSGSIPLSVLSSSRYVAFVDRRVGGAIYLDEARRCAKLLSMAEAIAEVAELRLEYEADVSADFSL